MPVQPPRGHLPACIAPLYVLARALHETFPNKGKPKFDLKPFSRGAYLKPTVSGTHAGEHRRFNLTVSGFKPSRIGVEVQLDLTLQPRIVSRSLPPSPWVRGGATPESVVAAQPPADDEDELSEEDLKEAAAVAAAAAARAEAAERAPKPAAIMLVPPFQTCFVSEHLSATAQWQGLRGLPRTAYDGRTFPTDAAFSLPSVAVRLIEDLRDILAEGGGHAVLLETAGDKTLVPTRFWRSEAAEAVLAGEVDTVVPLEDGRKATGSIWFDEVALDAAWRQMRGTAAALVKPERPAETEPASPTERKGRRQPPHTAVPRPTAWMIFMQEVALEFGYSGGRPFGPHRFTKDQLAAQLRTRWPDELGEWSQNYAESLAAFILHPSNRKVGNADNTTKAKKAKIAAEKAKIAGKKA